MKVLYFYHIPKCGGSFVYHLLKKLSKKVDGNFVPFINLDKNKKNPKFDADLKEFIGTLKDYSKNDVVIIHHHHGYPGVLELQEMILEAKLAIRKNGGEMVVLATVREPLSFAISKVNYLQKKGKEINYNQLINKEANHNMLSKYLLHNHIGRWQDETIEVNRKLLEKSISLFDRIFLMDNMEELTLFLNDFLGTKNVQLKGKINKGDLKCLPTENVKKKIIALNQLDQHFYNLVKNKEIKERANIKTQNSYFTKIPWKWVTGVLKYIMNQN